MTSVRFDEMDLRDDEVAVCVGTERDGSACGWEFRPEDISWECSNCHSTHGVVRDTTRTSGTVKDRYPDGIGPWRTYPERLLDRRADLGLDTIDVLIVIALERYRRRRGQWVFPNIKGTLDDHVGCDEKTVRIHLDRLVRRGLLGCRDRARVGGRWPKKEYDLGPLWAALAGLPDRRGEDPTVADSDQGPPAHSRVTYPTPSGGESVTVGSTARSSSGGGPDEGEVVEGEVVGEDSVHSLKAVNGPSGARDSSSSSAAEEELNGGGHDANAASDAPPRGFWSDIALLESGQPLSARGLLSVDEFIAEVIDNFAAVEIDPTDASDTAVWIALDARGLA